MAVRKKVSTRDLISALEAGGLPKSTYQTIYGVLRRRAVQIGDIISMDGDWALAEWYPNHVKSKPPPAKGEATKKEAADIADLLGDAKPKKEHKAAS